MSKAKLGLIKPIRFTRDLYRMAKSLAHQDGCTVADLVRELIATEYSKRQRAKTAPERSRKTVAA